MNKALIDLNQGLTLNSSDLTAPFVIKRLPLWPKPGAGWASHPGFLPFDEASIGYQPGDELYHSDTSGLIGIRRGNTLIVRDTLLGTVAEGVPPLDGADLAGVMLPRTGWYRSRDSYIFPGAPSVSGVNLKPPKNITGNLDPGIYRIWALTYLKLNTGLMFVWYAVLEASVGASSGIEIGLAEKPGERVVRLYVQRNIGGSYGPLTFLAELTGEEDTFPYVNHLQEGATEEIAITKARGKHSAYYSGRYFYQADSLVVLGKTSARPMVEQPPGQAPTTGAFATYPDGLRLTTYTIGGSPIEFAPYGAWDAGVETSAGVFVAVRVGGETHIYHTPSGRGYNSWSLVYKIPASVEMRGAAASPSRVLFISDAKAYSAPLANDAFKSQTSWEEATLPGDRIKRVIWTGSQFAAIANGKLLLGGAQGTSWSVVSPPSSGDFLTFTEWEDIVYTARTGRYIILALQPLGGGDFFLRLFFYSGTSWTSYELKPYNMNGMVFRRFATLWSDGDDIFGVGVGLKEGTYWDACLPVPVSLFVDKDWFAFFRASQFSSGCGHGGYLGEVSRNPHLWGGPNTAPYGFVQKSPIGIGGYFVRGGETKKYVVSRNPSNGQISVEGPTDYFSVKGVPVVLSDGKGIASSPLTEPGYRTYNVPTYTTFFLPMSEAGPVYVGYESITFLNDKLQATRYAFSYQQASLLGGVYERGGVAIITYHQPTNSYRLYVGNPPSLAQVSLPNLGTQPYRATINWVRHDGGRVYIARDNGVYVVNGGSVSTYTPGARAVVTDGQDWYAVGGDGVYKIESSGLTLVKSGVYLGGVDGPNGTIHVAKDDGGVVNVYALDLSTGTETLLGELTGATDFDGGVYTGGTLVALGRQGGLSPMAYVYDGSAFQEVEGLNWYGWFGLYGTRSGGGDSGGTEPPGEDYQLDINLPPNTVVWTEPGYLNVARAYNYHTFVPRTSRTITHISEHPAGVMVFMENEAYVMTGRFTSITDTRIALYPQTVGADPGSKITRVGSTLFVPWSGRLYAIGDGEVSLISYAISDGVPIVGVAYDPQNTMLVVRKENGSVYRYDMARRVWFDDLDNCIDIAQMANGVLYVREFTPLDSSESRIGLYRLAGESETIDTPYYYRPAQEVWIESVRLHRQGQEVNLTPVKRLRAVYLSMKSEGPPNPHIRIYNEHEVLVASGDMVPTLTSNTFGIAQYHFRFPPVITFALARIAISFQGVRFTLASDVEVHYEARERRI